MSFTGSGSPGSSPYLVCSHSCEMDCLEERHQGSKESYNEREKTALRCMRAAIELSQPQLYGTSYLLVRIALTGQLCARVTQGTLWAYDRYRRRSDNRRHVRRLSVGCLACIRSRVATHHLQGLASRLPALQACAREK